MSEDQLIVTANPTFIELALDELQAAVQVVAQQPLAEGVLLVTVATSFWEVAEAWRREPPIFVRHISPVQQTVPLRHKMATDLAILRQNVAATLYDLIDPTLPLSVQSRLLTPLPYKPFDVNSALANAIQAELGVPIDVRKPAQILSVVGAVAGSAEQIAANGHQQPPTVAYLGVAPTIYHLSDWAGGMRRFAREREQVSRAEFKLLEALEYFDLQLPPRGVALDLGAAPGGWTRVLRQRDQYVTAVDPGELAPTIAADRGVRHKRLTAEAYLADEPDRFDLIVNDMRMDARDSARLMVSYAKQLYRHGLVIMTLKLPEDQRKPIIDHALAILQSAYHLVGARQLFHNRSEITLFLRPLDGR